MIPWILGGVGAAALASGALLWPRIRARGLDQWLPEYWRTRHLRLPLDWEKPVHLLLCIADHFEPKRGNVDQHVSLGRVERWLTEYPRSFGQMLDSDGRPPQHTFFYPAEEYEPELLDRLARLCQQGFGEVEVHLHHDDDTPDGLRQTLLQFKQTLSQQHGLLSRHGKTGEVGYAFIHGNWALDNSRPDGRWCGVNNELDILRETGCFVDMTAPSAPSPTQTKTINSIYCAVDDPLRPKSHDRGLPLTSGELPAGALLLIQGPLFLDWRRRKWGLVPRVENGCLQANQSPTMDRLDLWLRSRVQLASRPDWYFVKLYTHGAEDKNANLLLGPAMQSFHLSLADLKKARPQFHFHYVTAREMTNLALAALGGWKNDVNSARDFMWKRISPVKAETTCK